MGISILKKILNHLFLIYFIFFSSTYSFAGSIGDFALPTGGSIASGNITINQTDPGKLIINQTTNQGIINWQSFNVGTKSSVHFNTPGASAGVLNNISGGTSTILGSIFSNGRLFFTNPSGIIFGPGSQVKAEGLVATAMRISNQDFLNQNYNFTNNQIASLQNEGDLQAQYVALIAPQVSNKGTITTNVATLIAAGDDVKLAISDSNRLSVNINPSKIKTLSSNEGVIKSENGTVSIQANVAQELIEQTINAPRSADSLISENGVIKLISNSGSIKAKKVNLSSGPLGGTEIAGTIDASSNAKGGDIEITGKEIQIKSNSKLLATGDTGGGNILVGGDWQGSNGILQATYTTVEKDSLIDVSSLGVGDGGKIVVWSDVNNFNSKTIANGNLYAKANIGNGGNIETSGYTIDIENVNPNTIATHGQAGNYLIDPYNYQISSSDWSNINTVLSSSDIIITTAGTTYGTNYGRSNGSNLSGRIEFQPYDFSYTGSRAALLTLTAENNVEINSNITATNAALSITANADYVFGTGNLNLKNGTFTVNNSANNSELYSGVLSNLSLTKSGSGTLTLSGTNTYSGNTTVSAGTLSVTGLLGSGTYSGNISNSGTLAMGSGSNQTLSGVISGTGALTKSGAGTLTLSGNNTYTGNTTVSAGKLSLSVPSSSSARHYSPSYSISSGAILEYNTPSGTVNYSDGNVTYSGQGTIKKVGAGQIQWGQMAATFALDSGSLIDVQEGTFVGGSSGNEVWTNNRSSLNIASGASFLGVEAPIVIDALTGAGTLSTGLQNWQNASVTMGINNTQAGTYNSLGSATFSGSIINSENSISHPGKIIKSGSGTQTLSGTNNYSGNTTVSAGTLAVTGTLGSGTYSGNISNSGTLAMGSGSNQTLSGVVSGTGALTKSGNGTLTLSGNNTYSGNTTVSAGTLSVTGLLGSGTYSGNISNSGTLAMGSGSNQTLSGVVSGTGALTKSGNGTLTLSGNNTYSGNTTASAGKLDVYNSSSIGSGALTLENGTTLISSSRGASVNLTNNISMPSGSVTYDISFGTGTDFILSGAISGNGKMILIGDGSSRWIRLAGNNSFLGGIDINTSSNTGYYPILEIANNNALGSGTITSYGTQSYNNIRFAGDYTVNNNFQTANSSSKIDISSNGYAAGVSGAISGTGAFTKSGSGTLALSGNNAYSGNTTVSAGTLSVTGLLGSGTYSGNISNSGTLAMGSGSSQTLSGIISGTGALTKSGAGTLTLSGTNTYSGNTTVSAGTLLASGTLSDSSQVSVASGATYQLGQNDTVGSIAGAGNINLGSNTLTSAGVVDTTFSGIISGTGGLTLTGSNNLSLSGVNTYSGTTNINGGGLVLANTAALAANSITSSSGRFKTTSRISDLTVTGAVTLIGDVTTTGTQTYNNNVTIGAGSAANPLTISSQNSNINFLGTVKTGSGAKAAQRSLTVNAGTGNVTFNDRIGYEFNGIGFNPLLTADSPYALSVTGGNITLKGDVMTFETQTYNGAVKIGGTGSNGTTRTLLSMDPKITFNGTVDDTQANTHTLVAKAVQVRSNVLNSDVPEVNFNKPVSSTTKLSGYQGLTGYQIVSNEFGSIDSSISFGSVRLPSSSSSSSSSSSNSQAEQRNIENKTSSLKPSSTNSSIAKTGMTLSQMFNSFKPEAGTSFVKSIEIVYPDSPKFNTVKNNQASPTDAKSNNTVNQNQPNKTKPNNQPNQKQNSSGVINDDENL